MKNIKKILIVCTGNRCRSVMAEGYLAKRLKDMGISDTTIISAGTYATIGLKPTDEAIQVMKEHGIDISGYASTTLNKVHIDNADVILAMEPYHKEKILDLAPKTEERIYFLRKFSSEKNKKQNSIKDPIGKPVEFYRAIFEIIKDSIEGFLVWLKE